MTLKSALAAILGTSILLSPYARADEREAENLLRDKGLRKVGAYWILPAESELAEQLKSLSQLERDVDRALEYRDAYERGIANERQMLEAAVAERRRLTLLTFQAGDEDELIALLARIGALSDQITLLQTRVNNSREADLVARKVAEVGEAYTRRMLELRKLVDDAMARYAELENDADVQEALETLRYETGRKIRLGPRIVFERNIEKLEALSKRLATGTIELREKHGVLEVDVVVNEDLTIPMCVDTGASFVTLPWESAQKLNLRLDDSRPKLKLAIADGSIVEGQLVILESVRVGAFSAADVECVIMPEGLENVPSLLGGSYFQHFTVQINHDAAKMTLTRIEDQ